MFALDAPSTMSIPQMTWKGGIDYIGGLGEKAGSIFWSPVKAVLDPVEKSVEKTQNYASLYLNQTKSSIFDAITGILQTKNAIVESAGEKAGSVLSPLSSGLKWGVAIIVIGIALYVFLIAAPFLPKPSYGGRS